MEMLLVKDIEVHRVDREQVKLYMSKYPQREHIPTNGGTSTIEMEICTELVRGRRFVNRHGQEVCIGKTKEVGEILGLEYEAWEGMQEEHARLREELHKAQRNMVAVREVHGRQWRAIRNAAWWTRLKWVFIGIPGE